MNLNIKKAKWTSQSKQFFNTSEDNSVVLDVIISLSCKSQTGNGFEELVNALNDESINRKLKQVNILDTTYLYRHFYPDFKKFTNVSIPTEWYLTNKEAIERIKAKVVLKNWAEEIDNNEFRKYFQQIKQEFEGDKNGNGLLLGFRDTVIHKAAINSYKHKKPFDKCVDFILEECAHLCASFKSETNICYPAKIYSIGESIIKRFSLKINHISYKVHSETDSDSDNKNEKYKTKLNETVLEKAITDFMKQEVTNMNFFVVDTKGNLIYSNFALERFLNNELKAEQIDKEAWKTTSEVIKTGQMFTGEEKGRQGRIYLSMRAPLKIDDKIEGAIGISIDITDSKRIEIEKKRTEELEFLNRIQQIKISFQNEFTQFISQMAHDITSPLLSLEVFTKTCKNLNNDQQHMLAGITSNIRTIADDLLQKYKYNKRAINVSTEQKILISLALSEIIAQKQLQYHDNEKIKILLQYRAMDKFAFIKGNYSNFTRMISNLLNNAVESYK
ncbi:MAG: hypothetical protein IJ730_06205 [Alphaproteobacteria bacterium]|nr:hypothetical protein [Alphaproteobacteria bacterium]